MVFTSLPFAFFFLVFFFFYWLVFNKSLTLQNGFLLLGSYIFYGWWDWRLLILLIGTSLFTYFLGIWIGRCKIDRYRAILTYIGVVQGLGCLVFFKYLNFIIESTATLLTSLEIHHALHSYSIILPLGISFYIFRTISYLLDIKKGRIAPTTNWVMYFSYVAFFPCLISGPIDRAQSFIPQLNKKRIFDYANAVDGMRQILWGLFKKLVIADNCAAFTDNVFAHYQTLPASALWFSAFLYTFQIYADFSGYSDMAIGFANLLGIRVTRNFEFPFFSQNIAEFWRRWHISLTSWLTDYVFTPLSIYFRDLGKSGLILAITINFMLVGLWHGANWTYILFGALHGCYFIPLIIRGTFNKKKKKTAGPIVLINRVGTFLLVMLTFILFRADSLAPAGQYFSRLFSGSVFEPVIILEKVNIGSALCCIIIMMVAEWVQKDRQHPLQIDRIKSTVVRYAIYAGLVIIVLFFCASKTQDFIYFKF